MITAQSIAANDTDAIPVSEPSDHVTQTIADLYFLFCLLSKLVQKKKDKKHEAHLTLWADYTWIQRQAKRLKKSEEETAKMMGLEEAYALFSQTNTATQTQQVSQR